MSVSNVTAVEAAPSTRSAALGLSRLASNIARVVRGQEAGIRLLMAAVASGGHVLVEDVPGTGKTTLAKALACSLDAGFQRVQFTPDLLPADILGVSVFHPGDRRFEFHPGPVFTNVLLADEINRATPRTQSALLEAMAEGQVSIDRHRRELDDFFIVVATQNPIEFEGTYPLPEAQMDRFAMRFRLGYVTAEQEVGILDDHGNHDPLAELEPVMGLTELGSVRAAVASVAVSAEVKRYIVDLVAATRAAQGVRIGASPRASLALMRSAQALALLDGLEFVTPDLVHELTEPTLAHRLVLDSEARFEGLTCEAVAQRALDGIASPG